MTDLDKANIRMWAWGCLEGWGINAPDKPFTLANLDVRIARADDLAAFIMSGARSRSAEPLYCSFCGKSQHEVRKLIAGPTVFICDECVALCTGIIADAPASPEDSA